MAEQDKIQGLPGVPTLPTFPTAWGEKEKQRLEALEEQRLRMEELYKTKFSPEAWEGTPAPERVY